MLYRIYQARFHEKIRGSKFYQPKRGEHNQAYSIYLTQAYNFGIPLQAYSSIPTQADNCQNITKLDSSIL